MKTKAIKPSLVEKTCTKCQEQWPADAEFFHREPRNADGLTGECIACKASYDSYRISGRFSKGPGSLTRGLQPFFTRLINKYEHTALTVQ